MLRIPKPLIPLCLFALSACSTVTEGSQQQITFNTIGAVDALCEVRTGVNDHVYAVRPPQTIWIKKSARDMVVKCEAPGNRIVTKTIESDVAATTFLNPLNGLVPGAVYDEESGAMFKYPEVIDIDFTGVVATSDPLPGYYDLDGLDPERQGIEDYGPDVPKVVDDDAVAFRHKLAADKAAREAAEAAALAAEKESRINGLEGGFYGDKGNTK